jgi:hypothetical protein
MAARSLYIITLYEFLKPGQRKQRSIRYVVLAKDRVEALAEFQSRYPGHLEQYEASNVHRSDSNVLELP